MKSIFQTPEADYYSVMEHSQIRWAV